MKLEIPTVLTLLSLFLFLVLLFPFFQTYVFYGVLTLLLIFLILFRRKKYDFILSLSLLLAFLVSWFLFPKIDLTTLVLRTSAVLAFILLNLVLLIGPWSRFSTNIRKLYSFRRHLGVTTFFLTGLHVALIIPLYFSFSLTNALSSVFIFYGIVAFFILFWLALTSWDYLQKKVTLFYWAILHTVLLISYVALSLYFYSLNTLSIFHILILLFFGFIWISIAPYSLIKKIIKTWIFGWKQLHVLIYIAYFSIILHVSLGALIPLPLWTKFLFWGSVAFNLGSHGYGLVHFALEKKTMNPLGETISVEGITFMGLDRTENFEEGKGRRFYIDKKPIAVFKYKEKFITVSAVCPHQKGPLDKGNIVSGYIICPWHHWQYSVKDGTAPVGYRDCVPYYSTKVIDGWVYVSINA